MTSNPNFPDNLDIKPSHALDNATAHSREYDVAAQADAIKVYGIAGRVWEAAYALKQYIDDSADIIFDPPFLEQSELIVGPRAFLELGSGTGIITSCLFDRLAGTRSILLATDLPEVCPLLEKNLQRYQSHSTTAGQDQSSHPTVLVRSLAWGNGEHALHILDDLNSSGYPAGTAPQLSHIICSDLVYFPELLAPLLRTLLELTSPPFATNRCHPKIVISYKIRSLAKETPFWSAFGLWFSFSPVLAKRVRRSLQEWPRPPDSLGDTVVIPSWERFGSSGDSDTFVFIGERRPESLAWEISSNDQELLEGVGARGDKSRKGDDTFEELLLMLMDVLLE